MVELCEHREVSGNCQVTPIDEMRAFDRLFKIGLG